MDNNANNFLVQLSELNSKLSLYFQSLNSIIITGVTYFFAFVLGCYFLYIIIALIIKKIELKDLKDKFLNVFLVVIILNVGFFALSKVEEAILDLLINPLSNLDINKEKQYELEKQRKILEEQYSQIKFETHAKNTDKVKIDKTSVYEKYEEKQVIDPTTIALLESETKERAEEELVNKRKLTDEEIKELSNTLTEEVSSSNEKEQTKQLSPEEMADQLNGKDGGVIRGAIISALVWLLTTISSLVVFMVKLLQIVFLVIGKTFLPISAILTLSGIFSNSLMTWAQTYFGILFWGASIVLIDLAGRIFLQFTLTENGNALIIIVFFLIQIILYTMVPTITTMFIGGNAQSSSAISSSLRFFAAAVGFGILTKGFSQIRDKLGTKLGNATLKGGKKLGKATLKGGKKLYDKLFKKNKK